MVDPKETQGFARKHEGLLDFEPDVIEVELELMVLRVGLVQVSLVVVAAVAVLEAVEGTIVVAEFVEVVEFV